MSKSIWPLGGLRAIVCSLFVLALAPMAPDAYAEIPGGGGEPPPATTAYFEQGLLIRSGEVVQALGPNLMGDSVNEYSGGLEFTQTDVSLPGNNATSSTIAATVTGYSCPAGYTLALCSRPFSERGTEHRSRQRNSRS